MALLVPVETAKRFWCETAPWDAWANGSGRCVYSFVVVYKLALASTRASDWFV